MDANMDAYTVKRSKNSEFSVHSARIKTKDCHKLQKVSKTFP